VLEKMPCEALLVAAIRTWLHDGIDRCLISSTRKKTLKDILEILEVLDPGKDLQKESRIDHTDSSHPLRKKKTHIFFRFSGGLFLRQRIQKNPHRFQVPVVRIYLQE